MSGAASAEPLGPAGTVAPPEASGEAARAGALEQLGRWLPRLSGLVRFAYRTAAVSAASAATLWWALAGDEVTELGSAAWAPALGLLALLLIPAGSAWLLGLTLQDVLTLPDRIRQGAVGAAATSREALASAPARGGRITGLIRAVWAARGFVLESKGAWGKAATAARLVRLARLPFVLGLLGLFALNAVVIVGGLFALWVLVL